jgi:hypothetical protein
MNFTGSVRENTKDGTYFFYYPAQDMSGPSFSSDYLDILTLSLDNQSNTLTWKDVEGVPNGVASTEDLWKYNLLYTPTAVDPSEGGITLTHACALLRFVLKLPANAPVVDKLYISTWDNKLPYPAVNLWFYGNGTASAFSNGTTNTLSLTLNGDEQKSEVRTITAYMMIPAVSDYSGQLCKVSLVNSSTNETYSYVYNLTGTKATDAKGNFKGGTVYTFAPSAPLQEDKWASSNIYWDGSRLAFDEPYKMGHSAAQGLFFKWGSLVGISPKGDTWSGDIPIYTYNPDADTYTASTAATWSSISPNGDGNDLSGDTEDICTAINSSWRMPNEGELETLITTSYAMIGERTAFTGANDAGTGTIYNGELYDSQTYLPFSAYRKGTDGALSGGAGTEAYYWSKTSNALDGVCLEDWAVPTFNILSAEYALPIRCIKAN